MVDRGFRIDEDLEGKSITLVRPTFVRNKEQLNEEDCEYSREISSARVHIERVMERLKNFRILHGEVQWNYLSVMDDVMITIAGIVNLSPRILNDQVFMYD